MSKKAKGLAVIGALTIGTGALVKSAKYIKNKREKSKRDEKEDSVNIVTEREKCIKIIEDIEKVTGETYKIGIPSEDDKVNTNATEFLVKLGLLQSNEALIVTK